MIRRKFSKSVLRHKYTINFIIPENEFSKNQNKIKNCSILFLYEVKGKTRKDILEYCIKNHIKACAFPDIEDILVTSCRNGTVDHLPIKIIETKRPSYVYLFIKRLFDIVASLLAIVILSPLFLVTAIAVKAEDGGPVLYKQERLTKNGKTFKILKFRSMRVDAEKDGIARLSCGDSDSRITKTGKFIRAVRLDELPQLINILKGDMSIVGPRPERPEIAEEYYQEFPEFELRLQIKAGLTGYAQVNGQYNSTAYDKLMFDLIYISHMSISEDFKIIFLTVKTLFMKDSTEGIADGQTNAGIRRAAEEKA